MSDRCPLGYLFYTRIFCSCPPPAPTTPPPQPIIAPFLIFRALSSCRYCNDSPGQSLKTQSEPAHEMMVLFDLRKLILQTWMRSHPVGLDVCFFVGPFVYFRTSCVRTTKVLARVCRCAGSPEPSLVAYLISTIISWAGSFRQFRIRSASLTQYLMLKPQVFKF